MQATAPLRQARAHVLALVHNRQPQRSRFETHVMTHVLPSQKIQNLFGRMRMCVNSPGFAHAHVLGPTGSAEWASVGGVRPPRPVECDGAVWERCGGPALSCGVWAPEESKRKGLPYPKQLLDVL